LQTAQDSRCGGKRIEGILPETGADHPLFTVVTAVFNGAETLETTIQSVLCQTYKNVEYIIIDGGSTDGTLDIIRKYEHAVDYWLSEPDKGVYDAFNKSCPFIRGEWTIFLGAGDVLFDPEVLATVALVAQEASHDTELIYGRVCITDDADAAVKVLNRPWAQMRGRWRGGRPMLPHHQGVFQRKSILGVSRPFDTKYRIAADSTLIYRSIGRVAPFFCDTIITRAPIGGVSTEPKYFIPTAHEILKINREFGHRNYAHQLWFYLKTLAKSLICNIGGDASAKKLIDEYRVLTGRKRKWTIGGSDRS
jgi:glycosyltransferase involved in cell wall biosynthesis